MKKIVSISIVIIVILMCFVNVGVNVAAKELTSAEVKAQITSIYAKSRASRGSSFSGYCGEYVGWQLYHMGINSSYVARNGNATFDYYKNLSQTSGGYKVTSYPSSNYTLKSALNAISANGTKNVYNILVGLEKANTASGQTYGHATFIHAIIDGIVYFSESGSLTVRGVTYSEGQAISCDINYFCDYILMWTNGSYVPSFDGVIYFGESTQSSVDVITLSGVNYPTYKKQGDTFEFFGTVSSPNGIRFVQAYVLDSAGNEKFWAGLWNIDSNEVIKDRSIKYFNINSIDHKMLFASLPAGTYRYIIDGGDEKGYYFYAQFAFTVGSSATTSKTGYSKKGSHFCDSVPGTNFWDSGKITTSATCTSNGVKTFTCKECGATKTESITKLGHNYSSSWTVDTKATCTTAGSKSHHCTRCTAKADVTTISATGHTWGSWTITKDATCSTTGSQKRTCSTCNTSETATISALGHYYATAWTVDQQATCTAAGSKSHHCILCDAKTDVTTIAATGHTWGNWTTTKEATCTTFGSQKHTCTTCRTSETKTINALGHNYSTTWTVDKEATCTTAGSKSHHCTRCTAKTDVTTISATGHTWARGQQ